VITGAGAGVGRAVAEEFARHGWSVALLSRDVARLERAASELEKRYHIRPLAIPTDVASAPAVESAAEQVERELGPIHTWINVAMATVFGPVSSVSAAEVERGTQVTYLGQVYGMMAALKRMRPRNRGVIVNVGSALAYRSVPLQAIYCGAKAAIRGFTDSLRSELIHDKLAIRLTVVDLPAVNTPQFDWALNKTAYRPQPVPPIFQPEVPARAIYFAATHKRREIWLGFSTIKAVLANRLAPGLLDRYLAKAGYSGQLTHQKKPCNAPSNLFEPVPGPYGAHGRFDARAHKATATMFTERHRALVRAVLAVTAAVALHRIAKRRDF
jgi:short-subunit dehydrogenase